MPERSSIVEPRATGEFDPLVEPQEVPRVEEDAEEWVAQVAVDDGLQGTAGLAHVEGLQPLGDGQEVGRHQALHVVGDARRQLRGLLHHEAGPAVQRAPDAEGGREGVAALDDAGRVGLSMPSDARGPAESMKWQERGSPLQPARRAASCSVMPGRRPTRMRLTPSEVWQAAHSKAASCSTSLTARRPSAASTKRSLAFSTRPAGTDGRPQRVDQVGGHLKEAPIGERLPAGDPDACPRTDALRGQDLGQRPRAVAGLAGQAEVLVELHPHGQRGIPRQPLALVADEDERVLVTRHAQDEDRLLEARIEAGQVAQVGAVLAIGVDEEAVVASVGGARPRPIRARGVQLVRQERHGAGHAEVGQLDGLQARRRHGQSSGSGSSTGWSLPRLMRSRWSAATSIHAPTSPSGQVTRRRAVSDAPRPKWTGPSWPPACPPPMVSSRVDVCPSCSTSIQEPMASRVGCRLLQLHR